MIKLGCKALNVRSRLSVIFGEGSTSSLLPRLTSKIRFKLSFKSAGCVRRGRIDGTATAALQKASIEQQQLKKKHLKHIMIET
jgi:hypothetical protein